MLFREIVLKYAVKGDLVGIPNIMIHKDCKYHYTQKLNLFHTPANLCSNVYSNRELIKKYDDAYRVGKDNKPIAFMETSLGCTSRCTFCSIWPVNNGEYYKRSIQNVIDELKTMEQYDFVRLADANTMGDTEHAGLLFERIIEEGLIKEFVMDIRADTAVNHPWLIAKAAEAGLKVAIVGIESDNEDELNYYNKESTVNLTLKALEVFVKYGVDVRGICIIQPDYNENDFHRLSCFLGENNLTHSAFSIMTPFPGTQLYNQVSERIIIKDLDYYNLFNSVFETKLPEEEFYKLSAEMFRGRKGIR
jgi:radical SAM superfamily enzyme YgiQ (UPF0313 family)